MLKKYILSVNRTEKKINMYSSSRRPPPQVTGISPKEGPPGTRVTIRGENLGVDSRDLMSK